MRSDIPLPWPKLCLHLLMVSRTPSSSMHFTKTPVLFASAFACIACVGAAVYADKYQQRVLPLLVGYTVTCIAYGVMTATGPNLSISGVTYGSIFVSWMPLLACGLGWIFRLTWMQSSV